jgi:hemerythrin
MQILEFLEYSQQAWQKVKESDQHTLHTLRYGQALYLVLPDEFFEHIYQTDKDFFYWGNERAEEIDQICYAMCADYEDMWYLGVIL